MQPHLTLKPFLTQYFIWKPNHNLLQYNPIDLKLLITLILIYESLVWWTSFGNVWLFSTEMRNGYRIKLIKLITKKSVINENDHIKNLLLFSPKSPWCCQHHHPQGWISGSNGVCPLAMVWIAWFLYYDDQMTINRRIF